MSALVLHKARTGTLGSHDACMEADCNRKGRFVVQIAGYPVPSASRIAESDVARLCEKHAGEWKRLWAELSGAVDEGQAIAA